MSVRRIPFSMILFLMMIFICSIVANPVVGQTSADSTIQSPTQMMESQAEANDLISDSNEEQAEQKVAGFNQDTLMKLIYYSGTIGVLTIIVLAIGLLVILMNRFRLGEDISNSQWVLDELTQIKIDKKTRLLGLKQFISRLKGKYETYLQSLQNAGWGYIIKANLNAFKQMFIKLGRFIARKKEPLGDPEDTAVKTTVFELLYKLYQVFDSTRDTDNFNSELANYIQLQKDKFNPFQTVMAYLSDTAGALGLLGTVWGMFLTFFKGTMEQQEIISGMGIALSTTIIGLVVSLILNTFTTTVSSKFDSHLETITKMANDLQISLMKLGLKKRVEFQATKAEKPDIQPEHERVEEVFEEDEEFEKVEEVVDQPKLVKKRVRRIVEEPEFEPDVFYPAVIKVLEGANQMKPVTSKLDNFRVMVKDKSDIPVSGIKVYFSVCDSGGVLNGGRLEDEVETNDAGVAEVQWTLGEQSGEKYLSVTAENYTGKEVKIKVTALPIAAEKLSLVSGNYQAAPPGEELRKPFVVRVEDKYKNPIEKVAVTFKMMEGKGAFPKKEGRVIDERNGTCTVTTNQFGIAETEYIFGQEQGVYKVTAETRGIDRQIQFQVFAKYD